MQTLEYLIHPKTAYSDRNIASCDFNETTFLKHSDKFLIEEYKLIYAKSSLASSNVSYTYENVVIATVPSHLNYLINSFKKSESILLLEDDWDDNGSKKYSIETWKSAIKFVAEYATNLYVDFNIAIDNPKIYNGPQGSIDLFWEYESYTLLINVHENGTDASFYGDNTNKGQSVRGEFKLFKYQKTLIPFAIQN